MIKLIKMRKYQNANIDYEFASLPIIEEEVTAYLKDEENPDGKFQINLNAFIEDYVDNAVHNLESGKGIVFTGPTGRGKSLSSMKILMKLVDKNYSGYFLTVKAFLDLIKQSWTDEEKEKLLNKIFNSQFLVIDDIGVEYKKDGSDWSLTEIDNLFRHRYYKKLPIIITTNSPLEKLKEKYAQRIISLFHERLLYVPIISKDDFREKKLSKIPNYMNKNKFMKGEN
jgi:DNA replication protein DnaC